MIVTAAEGGAPRRRRGWSWGLSAGALAVVLGLGAHAVLSSGSGRLPQDVKVEASGQLSSAPAELAPNGTYTAPSGSTATIASLRGKPTMVWFVVGGCASCAASIPAVASHLGQLTRSGLRVLTLGLYGDFPAGRAGIAQLLSFGSSAAGGSVERPDWLWGMASASLSLAYDPSGTPDVYTLIGPRGHIRYRNSAPVSAMPRLLAAAVAIGGERTAPDPRASSRLPGFLP